MPKKILILRFSSIGDIVLTTPVIRCIKTQLPETEIQYATKKHYASILNANPYISKLHLFEDKKLPALMDDLAKEKFDLVIDLHNNLRTFLIKNNLNIASNTFRKINFQKWLMVKLKINRLPDKHIVDRYLDTTKELGIVNDGKGLDYFIPEKDEVPVQQLPFTHLAGYCVIVVGAKHFTKQIPMVKLEELCSKIKIPILLLGGPDDVYLGLQLENKDHFKISSACGRYNINQSAAVIKRAKYIITPDTGMMHIAAAFNKRIISIWGGTEKRLGFTPYLVNNSTSVIIENNQLSCRPCHRFGLDKCPKGHFKCMMDLDMQKVVDVL